MEEMKRMKEMLMGCIQGQMTHLDSVDTKELGEVIDMVKDLSEAIYYCTITKAMEGEEHKEKEHHSYAERYYSDPRMMDQGRMYYPYYDDGTGGHSFTGSFNPMSSGARYYSSSSNGSSNASNSNSSSGGVNDRGGGTRNYSEYELTMPVRDEREGRSPMTRKTYMEYKQTHQDKTTKLRELERYMQELTSDMVEMIEGASPEEKQLLEKRISALATKIGQTNG